MSMDAGLLFRPMFAYGSRSNLTSDSRLKSLIGEITHAGLFRNAPHFHEAALRSVPKDALGGHLLQLFCKVAVDLLNIHIFASAR